MSKRDDINKIMIIGSGPIIIGQACEFDYSGTQACKALKEEGYEVVLVNSNPATIMTDPEMADKTYIEPLTLESVEKIIEKERPDALLPNLGGQTGLNIASGLYKSKVLEKYNVEVIGVQIDAIERGEDRIAFKETMNKLGVPVPKSSPAHSINEAEAIAGEFGYPVVLRPAFTMGGTGGGIAYNIEELRTIASRGLAASLVNQVLIEESVLGWEELELEVVRDKKNQKITVCFIENVDAMGIHTGDSFCVAPMLTVPQKLQQKMQEISYKIVDAIGVTGGTNVQLAHNLEDDRLVVIEINPRTSRSSALASKATGFPIARISTKLATDITMDEIPYWKEGTLEKYEPTGDYVVVKFARWAFEKFSNVKDMLGTQMRAVGEAMSIGKDFKESFQKAIRSLEIDRYGLSVLKFRKLPLEILRKKISTPSSQRIFLVYEALRRGFTVEELYKITYIGKWFLNQIKELVDLEEELLNYKWDSLPDSMLIQAKENGFSDKYLSQLFKIEEKKVRQRRKSLGKISRFDAIAVSGVENAAYYYSTYQDGEDQVPVSKNKKIMILGGGPNRIGQGIEFDYTCVHGAFALKEEGYESIMVNCNPETVSTDYDTSNKLYFEPLTVEDVLTIHEKEKPEGVIVQFGGQTPLNIAQELKDEGVKILGTSPENIRSAEDREYFKKKITSLGIPQPESGIARSSQEAVKIANEIGYPLMVRPSFVLGGRAMAVIYDQAMLRRYSQEAIQVSPQYPMLIDRFLEDAVEVEVDALSDGDEIFIPSVMEHIELAGVHSGDSACTVPSHSLKEKDIKTIEEYTAKIAKELGVVGLMNIQYALCDNKIYILEANPRASRTVPVISKITSIPLARIATKLILGKKIKDFPEIKKRELPYIGVKEAVFPFNMFPEVDPVLGPEMRATGEVMGIANGFGLAFYKAQEAAGSKLPKKGNVLLTVADKDKDKLLPIAKKLKELGFIIYATEGTKFFLEKNGIKSNFIKKMHEGRPNIVDNIKNKKIHLIINTPVGSESKYDDSYIRISAIQHGIAYITSIAAALASVEGIGAIKREEILPESLQDYYRERLKIAY
ncbi:MAG: carbamoyl-phosphate synthase large subunit [Candidatus Omnitrophica bacterium]|nr:carbamoyl-phosphate synthase large subunit [Candidatus Omnitrophota bacterium]